MEVISPCLRFFAERSQTLFKFGMVSHARSTKLKLTDTQSSLNSLSPARSFVRLFAECNQIKYNSEWMTDKFLRKQEQDSHTSSISCILEKLGNCSVFPVFS